MQAKARQWRAAGRRVVLVPTMGALHEGHLALVRAARRRAGPRGAVVVSIYVNPTQFGPKEDFARYPRPFARDCRLCRAAGADAVFAPSHAQMYPRGFSTFIEPPAVARRWEGASRPGHFRGVCTVVAKLFHAVQPDAAVFGQKDFQQAAVIRAMARDLDFPLRLFLHPTVRERDGLAMSSRNAYLSGTERKAALALSVALRKARQLVRHGQRRAAAVVGAMRHVLAREPKLRADYIVVTDAATLEPVPRIRRGRTVALLAARVGGTRLIDNVRL